MSFAEIEAELDKLGPDDLRRLAIKSWTAFVQKEGRTKEANECDESEGADSIRMNSGRRRSWAGQNHTAIDNAFGKREI